MGSPFIWNFSMSIFSRSNSFSQYWRNWLTSSRPQVRGSGGSPPVQQKLTSSLLESSVEVFTLFQLRFSWTIRFSKITDSWRADIMFYVRHAELTSVVLLWKRQRTKRWRVSYLTLVSSSRFFDPRVSWSLTYLICWIIILYDSLRKLCINFRSPGSPLFTWVSRGDGGGWARKGLG